MPNARSLLLSLPADYSDFGEDTIHNGKIWVEADNTDQEIVQQLLDAGIPREAIVLAFYSPQKRRFTEFAVA